MKRLPLAALAGVAALALAVAAPSGALAHQQASTAKIALHEQTKPKLESRRAGAKRPTKKAHKTHKTHRRHNRRKSPKYSWGDGRRTHRRNRWG